MHAILVAGTADGSPLSAIRNGYSRYFRGAGNLTDGSAAY
jgi:hypothetical protein